MKTEWLYGIHPVYEALAAGRRKVYEVYLDSGKKSGRLAQIRYMAQSTGILKTCDAGKLTELAGTDGHQGVAAKASPYRQVSVNDILQTPESGDNPFVLMLDNIQDPRNLGAVIRTALCVGVHGVIVPKDRSAPPTPAVSKASAGALEHIRLVRVTNLVQTIKHCKSRGLWIVGLQKGAGQPVFSGDLTGAIALVLGGEQKGVRQLVRKNCDFMLSIPQQGPLDSLNVAVAASVAMYEAYRQRNQQAG